MSISKKYIKSGRRRFPWHISAQKTRSMAFRAEVLSMCGSFSAWTYDDETDEEPNPEMICRNCVKAVAKRGLP